MIEVAAGTYDEVVNVNIPLTIKGANAGIAGNGVRGSESIVDGNNGAHPGFQITANDVTIDGFKVQNCALGTGEAGIYFSGSNTTIMNNVLFNNAKGVYPSNTGASSIHHNLFDANNRPGPGAQVGLYAFTTNALSVLDNEFKGQTDNAAVLFDGTASTAKHIGLLFKRNYLHNNDAASSAVYAASLSNAEFSNNRITNGLRGFKIAGYSTVNIHNNYISGTGEADILVVNEFGANISVLANSNHLTSPITIKNTDALTVNATCNWLGSTVAATNAATISGPVTYIPFLTSGVDMDANPGNGFQPNVPCAAPCNFVVSVTTTDATCPTLSDGTATANVLSGGVGPYTYNWMGYALGPLEGQNG